MWKAIWPHLQYVIVSFIVLFAVVIGSGTIFYYMDGHLEDKRMELQQLQIEAEEEERKIHEFLKESIDENGKMS